MGTSALIHLATDLGDSGLLLPVALVGVVLLWFLHSPRLSWVLLRSVLLAGVLIAALKILFLSCGARWVSGLVSPSGHACLSAVVYGAVATLYAAGRPPPVRVLTGAVAVAFVAFISVTRVALGVHTPLEVLVGLAVGGIALAWFIHSCAQLPPLRVGGGALAMAMAVTVMFAFGVRLPVESAIRHVARRVAFSCQAAAAAPVPAYRGGAGSVASRVSARAPAAAAPTCHSRNATSRAVSCRRW